MARKAEKIAKRARICVEKWRGYFKYNTDQYHEIQNFVLGRQWTDDEEDMLKTFKKVPLQFNKLATLSNTLLGEQQQNTPQLEIVPRSNCSQQTAELRSIIVKDIMLSTDAKKVYQQAAKQAFIGGFGAFIVDTDYVHDKSFEQDIVYRYLKDATRAYWDIGAEQTNKTDGMYSGYIARMTRKKFRSIYGKKLEKDINVNGGITQSEEEIALAVQPNTTEDPFNWADSESITLIHHYERRYVKDRLFKLSNGRVVNQEQMNELIEESADFSFRMREEPALDDLDSTDDDATPISVKPGRNETIESADRETRAFENSKGKMRNLDATGDEDVSGEITQNIDRDDDIQSLYDSGMPIRIEEERASKRSQIIHYLIAGDYILEEEEFPAEDLPVIFMDQNSYYDKYSKQICRPFIIDAIDAQRYLNYLGTQSAYILKVSRYDQFIGSKKNVQSLDTQRNWRDPNSIQGMITYDESPSGAKPEQLRPPELSASLMQQYERAINDMYTSTGMYPSRLGYQVNEISGADIDARTRQGSYPTYVAFNSVNEAITAAGKIVNQMIPRVYDSERTMNLMTPDKGRQNITINKQSDEYGEIIENDLSEGEFDVILQAGPSYEGQKAEALQSLNMVLAANPELLNLFADLYAENLPLVNTLEIKNRLKTIVPPEIIEAGKSGQMPQKGQQAPNPDEQAMAAEAQFKQAQIQIKQQELQLKMEEARMKQEQMQMEIEMKRLELMAELEEQKLRYLAETDRTQSDNAISHANNITKILTHKLESKPHDQRTNKQY